jgi:hypothetical protein
MGNCAIDALDQSMYGQREYYRPMFVLESLIKPRILNKGHCEGHGEEGAEP